VESAGGQGDTVDGGGGELQLADPKQHFAEDRKHLRGHTTGRSLAGLVRAESSLLCANQGTHLPQTRVARRGNLILEVHGHTAPAWDRASTITFMLRQLQAPVQQHLNKTGQEGRYARGGLLQGRQAGLAGLFHNRDGHHLAQHFAGPLDGQQELRGEREDAAHGACCRGEGSHGGVTAIETANRLAACQRQGTMSDGVFRRKWQHGPRTV